MYRVISKNFMKLKNPYTIQYKRLSSHNHEKNPEHDFVNDLIFFAVGMWCGYVIGKDKKK
jgi:hypothetical protein